MSSSFRAVLVLKVLGRYSFGDHVSDPRAYSLRIATGLRARAPLRLEQDVE